MSCSIAPLAIPAGLSSDPSVVGNVHSPILAQGALWQSNNRYCHHLDIVAFKHQSHNAVLWSATALTPVILCLLCQPFTVMLSGNEIGRLKQQCLMHSGMVSFWCRVLGPPCLQPPQWQSSFPPFSDMSVMSGPMLTASLDHLATAVAAAVIRTWMSLVGFSEEHAEALQAMAGCSFSSDVRFQEESAMDSPYPPGMLTVSSPAMCLLQAASLYICSHLGPVAACVCRTGCHITANA